MNKKTSFTTNDLIKTLPGTLICVGIAILSTLLSRYIPKLGAPTLSILIGILVGNTMGQKEILNRGTKFCEHTLLSISIVFLGATLSISSILHIGISGLSFIILEMIIVTFTTISIGKAMNFSQDFSLLMASGNAVCGSSAIAATAPVIFAHSRDKGISITMVNVTGTVLMLILPLLTSIFFNNSVNQSSAFIGGILQSVGQVVACGDMLSEEIKDLATIYKIVRILFLVGVVFVLALIKEKSTSKAIEDVEAEIAGLHHHRSAIKIPWYIVGFFITCTLHSFNVINADFSHTLKEFSNFFEIIALAGIGMRVFVKDLLSQGIKTSLYCVYIALVQIISSLALVWILI